MGFDKYAMKNNLHNELQITYFLMASKNIFFGYVCHVIVYRKFSFINYFCPMGQFRSQSAILECQV